MYTAATCVEASDATWSILLAGQKQIKSQRRTVHRHPIDNLFITCNTSIVKRQQHSSHNKSTYMLDVLTLCGHSVLLNTFYLG